jgi:hypothetical protein
VEVAGLVAGSRLGKGSKYDSHYSGVITQGGLTLDPYPLPLLPQFHMSQYKDHVVFSDLVYVDILLYLLNDPAWVSFDAEELYPFLGLLAKFSKATGIDISPNV